MSNDTIQDEVTLDAEEFSLGKLINFLNSKQTIDYGLTFKLVVKKYFVLFIELRNTNQINMEFLDEVGKFVKIVWIVPVYSNNTKVIRLECISWKQRKAQEKTRKELLENK